MDALQKIEIDFDIHKLIEGERSSFAEPPYVALRRLLKLPALTAAPAPQTPAASSSGLPFVSDGVTVPHGSLARMEYDWGAQVYEGQFLNGKLVVNDRKFDSLSAAANAVAITRKGKDTSLNGWNYWQAKFPGESKWRQLSEMRKARK